MGNKAAGANHQMVEEEKPKQGVDRAEVLRSMSKEEKKALLKKLEKMDKKKRKRRRKSLILLIVSLTQKMKDIIRRIGEDLEVMIVKEMIEGIDLVAEMIEEIEEIQVKTETGGEQGIQVKI